MNDYHRRIEEKGKPIILTGDEIQEWLENPYGLVRTSKDNQKRIYTYPNVKIQAA